MNDIDEIEFNMFLNVEEVLKNFKNVWQSNVNIYDLIDSFKVIIRQLTKCREIKLKSPKGITIAKNETREILKQEMFIVKQSLLVYYQNNLMKANIALYNYKISKLTHISDDSLYMEATKILEKAMVLAPSLLPIGITGDMISKLDADIKKFHELITDLGEAIEADIENNKEIKLKITAGKSLLKDKLDNSLNVCYADQPKFLKLYKISRRRIQKPGKHKTYRVLIKGNVRDAITKLGIDKVIIIIGMKKLVFSTDSKGNFSGKVFKKDADFISFGLPGKYIELKETLSKKYFKNTLTINVELVPIIDKPDVSSRYYID